MLFSLSALSSGEHIGCPFATQEESGFEDELPAFSFLSFDPIMVAEQFTLMDAVSGLSSFSQLSSPKGLGFPRSWRSHPQLKKNSPKSFVVVYLVPFQR